MAKKRKDRYEIISEEIKMYKQILKDPQYKNKKQLRGMIEARESQLKMFRRETFYEQTKKEKKIKMGKKKKTLFKRPKHKKYAKMISFKNPTQARISARKLRKEFREAKQNAKQLRIARATQYASNRAKASSKRKKLNTNERKQIKEIGKIYNTTANSMWKKYKHKKKAAFPKEVLKARSEGRQILTKEGKRKRTFHVATNGKKSKK